MKHEVIMQEMEMAMAAAAVHNLVPQDPATTLEPGDSYRGVNTGGHGGAIGHVADLHLIAVMVRVDRQLWMVFFERVKL
jgi:hypothetical protein